MIIERVKTLTDPAEVTRQAISIIKDHKLRTIDGMELEYQAEVLCFHGDAPNSVEVLKNVREELDEENINVTKWQCSRHQREGETKERKLSD